MNPFWQFNATELITIIAVVVGWVIVYTQSAKKRGELERKVNYIWEKVIEPILSKAITDNFLRHASPLRLNVSAIQEHKDIFEAVKKFYAESGSKLKDWELMSEIEKRFGSTFSEVAKERSLSVEGFVIAAVFLVRPEMELFKQWNTQEWRSN